MRCGVNPVRPFVRITGGVDNSKGSRLRLCVECRKGRNRHQRGVSEEAKRHKKTFCEHCGFVALHKCQLDVDHIDGNRDNNAPANLQTLCANCHRLKTQLEGDYRGYEDHEPEAPPQLRLVL